MADFEDQISNEEKERIAHDFITYSPPGEVETVLKDVRILLNNDSEFDRGMLNALQKFRVDQFTPTTVEESPVLLTVHGKLDKEHFYDPRSKKSFRYNFSSKAVSEVKCHAVDESVESWRHEIDVAVGAYVKNYYPHGIYSVYGKTGAGGSPLIVVCMEDHKFSPENFWNGRWRSEWQITIEGGNAEVVGILKSQVHYYEDGNVQLVSRKECKDNLTVSSEKQLAGDVAKLLAKCEHDYQAAIAENYHSMSSTTFKALRRQLPHTRQKIDWNKLLGYRIGKEIGK